MDREYEVIIPREQYEQLLQVEKDFKEFKEAVSQQEDCITIGETFFNFDEEKERSYKIWKFGESAKNEIKKQEALNELKEAERKTIHNEVHDRMSYVKSEIDDIIRYTLPKCNIFNYKKKIKEDLAKINKHISTFHI